ncbi:MAG: DUF2017 family protein [Acidimicrobiia bacterium]
MTAINSHFALVPEGVELQLTDLEVTFLMDLPRLLASLGTAEADPGAARLSPPVYLGDPEADAEWRRLAGTELEASRRADRSAFEVVLEAVRDSLPESRGDEPEGSLGRAVISRPEADAVLRVVNEARLVLGARWGIETAGDYDDLRPEASEVLSFLGWLVSDLAEVLEETLGR